MGSEVPLNEQAGELRQDPDFIRAFIQSGLLLVSDYGWYITFAGICLVILWTNVEPKIKRWINQREQAQISAQIHKDPDSVLQQQEALMLARQRLQAQHDQKAEVHREKLELEKEKKRNEKIQAYENLTAGRSTSKSIHQTQQSPVDKQKTKKKPRLVQNDYNPLTGGGGSSNRFRPSQRSGGG